MELNTAEAVQDMYRTALRQELANRMIHDHEWKRFETIGKETERRLVEEHETYQSEYPRRLAEAQQIILREVHGNILEKPQADNVSVIPDDKTLTQKAEARIRNDHLKRMSCIRQDETDQYEELKKAVVAREDNQGQARSAFEEVRGQSVPNRSGPSR